MQIGFVKAATHGPEYSWHKYWSRKPANVISAYLEYFVPEKGLVVDPFCGSGVVLRESSKLGFEAIGFDVNPSAQAISNFLLKRVTAHEFRVAAIKIIEEVESRFTGIYGAIDGSVIRFLEHHAVVVCSQCLAENVYSKEVHGENRKKCSQCGYKLSFGLSSLTRTSIKNIVLLDSQTTVPTEEYVRQELLANTSITDTKKYNADFVNNRRTLTSNKLGVENYFTKRNFGILVAIADMAHQEPNDDMRNALLLMVTASSAQASRLIASRGGLKTGGQAWTIPGFWIPPIHIESNPFIHLRARVQKMVSALKSAENHSGETGKAQAVGKSAQEGLLQLIEEGKKADLVFLDPPYGDSVAFLEFSTIWNAFINSKVDYSKDISISDRTEMTFNANDYQREMNVVFGRTADVLSDSGVVLLTFNNNDLNSWKAIVLASQVAGLRVREVNYQDPAVISTKSQMSLAGSYVGDFYVIFRKSDEKLKSYKDIRESLVEHLYKVTEARGGSVLLGILIRFGLEYWLENNVDAEQVEALDDLIKSEFRNNDGTYSVSSPRPSKITLVELVDAIIRSNTVGGELNLDAILMQAKTELHDYGTPSLLELKELVFNSKLLKEVKNEAVVQLLIDFETT